MSESKQTLAHRLYTGAIGYDFVGKRKRGYIISAVVLSVCLLSLIFRGLQLGIDFKGGSDFQAPVHVTEQTVGTLAEAVKATGLPNMEGSQINTLSDDTVRVQTRSLETDEVVKVRATIAEAVGTTPDNVDYNLIGASWGKQITNQGLIALAVFLGLVTLMIAIYFRDWKMSIAAILALMHDLIVTVGVYSLVGFAFTPASLIAVLTILGYSLYDTVVVFDKVRENIHDLPKSHDTYSSAANRAVNQVLMRSINTTIIGVLPVAALLIAGVFVLKTGPLQDLGLAMLVGMIAGAYSSIFIATPLLCDFKEREPEMREHRARLERRAAKDAGKDKAQDAPEAVGLVPAQDVRTTYTETRPRGERSSAASGRAQPTRPTRSQRKDHHG